VNGLRISVNVVLVATLLAAGLYLLSVNAFTVSDRAHPGLGLRFTGGVPWLLAGGCFGLAAFAAAVLRAWVRGDVPMPPSRAVRPHPAYKGQLIVRYWYFVAAAVACFVAAYGQAERVAHRPVPEPGAGRASALVRSVSRS